eukprot:1104253-Pyramimonas_sp.AAC.1
MATGTRTPGTPVRGVLERDVRQRLFSPLHEMDGLDGPPPPEVHQISTPGTPAEAYAVPAPQQQQHPPTLQEITAAIRQE